MLKYLGEGSPCLDGNNEFHLGLIVEEGEHKTAEDMEQTPVKVQVLQVWMMEVQCALAPPQGGYKPLLPFV